jgi:hypothetical protein
LPLLGKSYLGQFLSKELERYKSGLQSELELLKSDLNKEFHSFSTQFSQIYQRRVTGVLEIHDQLCEIDKLVIWEYGGIDTALINTSPEDRATQALNKAWEEVSARLERILGYHSLLLDVKVYEYVHQWS